MTSAPTQGVIVRVDETSSDASCWTMVDFLLDELNGLCDQLLYFAQTPSEQPASSERDLPQQRIRRIMDSLGFNKAQVVKVLWANVSKLARRPVDIYGPALVLRTFEPDHRKFEAWLKSLPSEHQSQWQAVCRIGLN